jgi:hypothetical protein
LTLHKNEDGTFETKCDGNHDFENDLLVTVFNNGDLVKEYNFDEIKERSKIN